MLSEGFSLTVDDHYRCYVVGGRGGSLKGLGSFLKKIINMRIAIFLNI